MQSVVHIAVIVVVAIVFSLVTTYIWRNSSKSIHIGEVERYGVSYLQPVVTLMGELAEAQSAAVRNAAVQTVVINSAINAVDRADRRYGDALQLRRRWAETRKAVVEVIKDKQGSISSYERYGEVIGLVSQLAHHIADESHMNLDSETDSAYLIDTVLNQLPDVIVEAEKAADLAAIETSSGNQDSVGRIRVSVARYNVAVIAESVGFGLTKALDKTKNSSLGPNITSQFDAFRSAVDTFIPSGTRLRGMEYTDAGNLTRTSTQVRQTAKSLADAIFGEIDSILKSRVEERVFQRYKICGLTVFGLFVTLFLLVHFIFNQSFEKRERENEIVDDVEGGQISTSSRRKDISLIDARDLLRAGDGIRVGRGTASQAGERNRDSY